MPDEVILASKRKTANVKQPVFENSSHIVFDDDDDVEDDSAYIGDVEYEIVDENANADYTDEIIEDKTKSRGLGCWRDCGGGVSLQGSSFILEHQ